MEHLPLARLEDLYLAHHRALGHSAKTVAHYEDSFQKFDWFLATTSHPHDGRCLTSAVMNEFAGWLRSTPVRAWRGQTQRSVHGLFGVLKDVKAFTRWLADEGYLERAPRVPLPKLPQTLFPILSEADIEAVWRSRYLSGKDGKNLGELEHRNRALIAFMLDTGVRISEVAGLRLEDVDVAGKVAKVAGKGHKERLVYFQDGTAELLRRWLTIRGEAPGRFFWLSADGIRVMLQRIRMETGLNLLHAHQLRHTAFTMMVRARMPLPIVQRMAGHESLATTQAYLALVDEDTREHHACASPFERVRERLEPMSNKAERRLRAG